MKDAYYFPHDSNARFDIKIAELRQNHGWAGYGVYWGIIEVLRDQDGYRFQANKKQLLSICLGCASDMLEPVLDTCLELGLLQEDDEEFIYSPSLTKRMEKMDGIREKRRIAGAKGGRGKQSQSKKEAIAKQMLSIKEKESKEKESKVNKEATTIAKNSVDESDDSTTNSSRIVVPAQEIFDAWNEVWAEKPIPTMRELTKARRTWIKREYRKKRGDLHTVDDFRKFFVYLRDRCSFLTESVLEGKNWFSFDWLFKYENNFTKAYEGNYQDRG